MITATYALSGVLMAITGWLFVLGVLDAVQQTMAWTAIFFVASAAASSAYLTVGESFPLEVRAIAIALFYAFGTGVGGVAGPALFGALIDTGSRVSILWGYLLGGGLMVLGRDGRGIAGGTGGAAASGGGRASIVCRRGLRRRQAWTFVRRSRHSRALQAQGMEQAVAVEKQPYREAMARLGAAVNVITTDGPGGRAGFTASAVTSVTDTPPTLLVCANRTNNSYPAMKANARAVREHAGRRA